MSYIVDLNELEKEKRNVKYYYRYLYNTITYAIYNFPTYSLVSLPFLNIKIRNDREREREKDSEKREREREKKNKLYRSLIVSKPENQLLVFSPPKSISFSSFQNVYPEFHNAMVVNEWIEGVMIQLFYDKRINQWEISTKTSISGNYIYKPTNIPDPNVKHKTYREMFLEVIDATSGESMDGLVKHLFTDYCYTFILQHPENNICFHIHKPQLYLVNVFEIKQKENVATINMIPPFIYESWPMFSNMIGLILFPKQYMCYTYSDLFRIVNNVNTNMCVGYIITNYETGERTKIVNKTYKRMDKTMLLNPCDLYNYLCLCKTGKTNDFLIKYPAYVYTFYQYTMLYNNMIINVQNAYYLKYISKSVKETGISKKYRYHVYKLHKNIYLPSLKTKHPITITKQVVRDYFSSYEPHQLLYYLSFERRLVSMGYGYEYNENRSS